MRPACSRSTSTAGSRACRSRLRSPRARRRSRFVSSHLPTVSYGVGLCVRAASAALRGGASVNEAAAEAEKVAVALDNVFLARSAPRGRVSASDEWTILRFASGEAHALSAHSSFDDASTVMGRRVLRGPVPDSWPSGTRARRSRRPRIDSHTTWWMPRSPRSSAIGSTPSVGAHTGPDSFGAFWWPAWTLGRGRADGEHGERPVVRRVAVISRAVTR